MNNKLNRTLSFKDILILAFSTMIGWGWVSLTGTWAYQGGAVGAALAFALGAILCIFVGLTYCELTPMLPYAGVLGIPKCHKTLVKTLQIIAS